MQQINHFFKYIFSNNKKSFIYLALFIVILDRITKNHFINKKNFICNEGISFDVEIEKTVIYTLWVLFAIFVFLYIKKQKKIPQKKYHLLIFLFLGASLNILDRLQYGCVIDFIKLPFISFPLFNISDVIIFLSTILFLFLYLKEKS